MVRSVFFPPAVPACAPELAVASIVGNPGRWGDETAGVTSLGVGPDKAPGAAGQPLASAQMCRCRDKRIPFRENAFSGAEVASLTRAPAVPSPPSPRSSAVPAWRLLLLSRFPSLTGSVTAP